MLDRVGLKTQLTRLQDRSATFMGDGHSDLMFKTKDKDLTMMIASTWSRLGLKPFEDEYDSKETNAKLDA